MWLSFIFQFPAPTTGRVIISLKDLSEGKILPREATKPQKQRRCIDLLYL